MAMGGITTALVGSTDARRLTLDVDATEPTGHPHTAIHPTRRAIEVMNATMMAVAKEDRAATLACHPMMTALTSMQ